MSDLQDLVNSLFADGNLDAIANHVGASREETGAGIAAALPALMGALAGNASTPRGEQALAGALMRDHDGSLLDQLGGMLAGNMGGRAANGAGILGHLFGDQQGQDQVVNTLSGRSNVNSTLIQKLLPILAPLVLSYLGKRMRGGSGDTSGSAEASMGGLGGGALGGLLGGLLGQMMGGGDPGSGGGGLADVLGGLLGGGAPGGQSHSQASQSGPDLGSILGSIFGNR
jgi:hypothetical protein